MKKNPPGEGRRHVERKEECPPEGTVGSVRAGDVLHLLEAERLAGAPHRAGTR